MSEPFLCEFVGRVVVFVGGTRSPTQSEWDGHIEALRTHIAAHPDSRSCVWARGANLSPTQRKQLTDTLPKNARTAVLTSSLVDRGVVTAIAWFVDGVRAFSPESEPAAFAYLGLTRDEIDRVVETSRRLRAKMDM
jgi:hypothetical protein